MISDTLMIQGATSDAGKSALVTGLCRSLYRRGISVAPFKPQNMALNSAVTLDGGEIGRAQAVQAQACGLTPHSDMNPVLLKPNTDMGAQVIVHGKALANMDARTYHDYKPVAMLAVLESYQRLRARYDVIVVEGAGSPAEINLRDKDIANMGFAEAVDCPVLLIADIDRGGVFAHLAGTLALLSESERSRTVGLVINRFRGDLALLTSGIDWLREYTGKPVLGVLPYLNGLHLEAEDSLQRSSHKNSTMNSPALHADDALRVIVPAIPRLSNHTDFDALRLNPQVNFQYVGPERDIPAADLIILPGSKSVRSDLIWLRTHGWDQALKRHLRYGGKVLGLCGGFQMLGQWIHDPLGLEGAPGSTEGLGLFNAATTLAPDKQLRRVNGMLAFDQAPVSGYEIHHGVTAGPALQRPLVMLDEGGDGAISADDQVIGTYLHGLFDSPLACVALLRWSGLREVRSFDYPRLREQGIDRLADALEQHLDLKQVDALLGLN